MDYDIAVQGASFQEVQTDLAEAISDYVAATEDQDERTRVKLLARRAPLWVRLKWTVRVLGSAWTRDFNQDTFASFPVASAA